MQPAMKSDILTFLCLASLLGVSFGLTVGSVRLINNQTYIAYLPPSANRSVIECVYSLDAGEVVDRVYWEMWDKVDKVGTYEWHPTNGGQATGMLGGMVNLSRDDGDLELTKLNYYLGGEYLCGVGLTNGEMKTSSKEEVVVIDISGIFEYAGQTGTCNVFTSYKSAAVFPEPTLKAGLFSSASNVFYDEVSSKDWFKVVYPNSSVIYSYSNITFKIDENSPQNVSFRVEMGVTKSDGTYIPQNTMTSYSSSWNEYGCPEVKKEDNKEVYYFPGSSTVCRGGRKSTTKATMTCKSGYRPEGDVTIAVMRCNGSTLAWEAEEGQDAIFEDLQCVKDSGNNNNSGNNGIPSLVLLSACFFSIVLLFGFTRT